MRISDWSSDVCSSDLFHAADASVDGNRKLDSAWRVGSDAEGSDLRGLVLPIGRAILSLALGRENVVHGGLTDPDAARRSEEHTSELQSLMRTSYAVFCLKKKKKKLTRVIKKQYQTYYT